MVQGLFFDVQKGNWGTWWCNRAIRFAKLYHFPRDQVLNFPFCHSRIKISRNFSNVVFLTKLFFQSEESEPVKNLFEGVKNDSIDQIRAALSDCDVNARRNGRTALHNAVMRSTPKVISFLIEQGANVNALWKVISLYDSKTLSIYAFVKMLAQCQYLDSRNYESYKMISR